MRPLMKNVWMNVAKNIAERSTCSRKHVGTVVTSEDLERVLSVGYNGNAKGFPNECDNPNEKGNCGCIHSEVNALIKAFSNESKTIFVTLSPCAICAKTMINANVKTVYFSDYHSNITGLSILVKGGVKVFWMKGDELIIGPINSIHRESGNGVND